MPLPAPILDDRSYEQLRDELIRRIPVYTDEWTDHNPSDPGITLIELFSYLGETLLFRFNQIPETTNLAFLRLLAIPLRPAYPAHGMVTMTPPKGDTVRRPGERFEPTLVPRRSEARAGPVPFETVDEVVALPVEGIVVTKSRTTGPQSQEQEDFVLAAEDLRGLKDNEEWDYYTSEILGDPSDPEATPIDFATAVDGMIWIAVIRRSKREPKPDVRGTILNVGFIPEQQVDSIGHVPRCPGELDPASAPPMILQATTGGVDERSGEGELVQREPQFHTLRVVGDTSHGLSKQGVVRLQLPEEPNTLAVPPTDDPEIGGLGNFPPRLEDTEPDDVLFWLRGRRMRNDEPLGKFKWIGLNAAEVEQVRTARTEFLGTGTGQPNQSYGFLNRSVMPGSAVVETEEGERWEGWAEVDTFDASGPDHRHYTLDAEAGTVTFGNGLRGRAPQIGERIRVVEYRHGGGVAGNVPAGAISKLTEHGDVKLENPLPTRGGTDGEEIADALERVPGTIRRGDRAVTASDFQELALQTAGANIVRAETIPRFHPRTKETEAAGVVSVVVWPHEDPDHPNAPMPDRATLRRVCEWLDERRLITTELWVIPPTYRRIAVSIGLGVKPGYGVEAVRRWVELVLRQYLAPVPPYGPEGHGWGLGRRVHGPELEAAVLQVEGVAFIEGDLRVAHWDEQSREWKRDGNTVLLEQYEVPELWEITVVEGEPMEPGEPLGPGIPPPPTPPPPPAAPSPPPPHVTVGPPTPPDTDDTVSVGIPLPQPRTECG